MIHSILQVSTSITGRCNRGNEGESKVILCGFDYSAESCQSWAGTILCKLQVRYSAAVLLWWAIGRRRATRGWGLRDNADPGAWDGVELLRVAMLSLQGANWRFVATSRGRLVKETRSRVAKKSLKILLLWIGLETVRDVTTQSHKCVKIKGDACSGSDDYIFAVTMRNVFEGFGISWKFHRFRP
jgi:hypothetical protein